MIKQFAKRNYYRASGLVFAVVFGVFMLSPSQQIMAQKSGRALTTPQFTQAGAEGCLTCHAGSKMAVIAETPHGNADDPHAPYALQGCESCHGPGSIHVSRAGGGAGFPALLQFANSKTRADQKAACLACHAEDMGAEPGMEWVGSKHDTPRMTCSNCHQVHTTENPLATRAGEVKNCSSCHEDEIKTHRRFERQGIDFDKLKCSQCHDVHQLLSDPE
jgi:DmsE family decaheme c-type cytochrome